MIHAGLDGCSAPQVYISRLVATRNPKGFSVQNLIADVSCVCPFYGCDDDRFDRIHLRAEVLDIRIVSVCPGGSDHKEVAASGALAHPLKCRIDVSAATHQHEPWTEGCSRWRIGGVADDERLKPGFFRRV